MVKKFLIMRMLGNDMPNIHNMMLLLLTIGHRFGHQSGLDESSGRNSPAFLHGFAIRIYLVF